MRTRQAIVWVDRREAIIFHLQPQGFETTRIKAADPGVSGKHRAVAELPPRDDFFQDLAGALADATGILVVGPSSAKLDFVKYVYRTDHALTLKIVGVETLDKPTDRRLLGYVLDYFDGSPRVPQSLAS